MGAVSSVPEQTPSSFQQQQPQQQTTPYSTGPYARGAPPLASAPMMGSSQLSSDQLQALLMRGGTPETLIQAGFTMSPGPAFVPPPPPQISTAICVKNEVNLHKDSLRFVKDTNRPGCLFLEFIFDANTNCAITVLFGQVDSVMLGPPNASNINGPTLLSRLKPLKNQIPPGSIGRRHVFQSGSRQHFSQAFYGLEEYLCTSQFTESEVLNAPKGGDGNPSVNPIATPAIFKRYCDGSAADAGMLPCHAYPVVIVLESLLDASAPALGHVSTSDSYRVLMQCTYASLQHKTQIDSTDPGYGPDTTVCKEWGLRCLKQKIQTASGHVFQLDEIYGIDHPNNNNNTNNNNNNGGNSGTTSRSRTPAKGENNDNKDGGNVSHNVDSSPHTEQNMLVSGSDCVICLTEPRDTTIFPCRHHCICHDCAQQLRLNDNKCPICRAAISHLFQFKIDASNNL